MYEIPSSRGDRFEKDLEESLSIIRGVFARARSLE